MTTDDKKLSVFNFLLDHVCTVEDFLIMCDTLERLDVK